MCYTQIKEKKMEDKNHQVAKYDFLNTSADERTRIVDEICNGDDWEKKQALISHIEAVQDDVRGEIKQRINQRDSFAIQYLVAIGAIITAVLSTPLNISIYFLLVAPLLAIFYTTQILYSYSMTDKISKYIMDCLDKPIEKILGTEEWESYSWRTKQATKTRSTGIRKDFFRGSMWVITLLCISIIVAYITLTNAWQIWNILLVLFGSVINLYLCLKIEISLYRKKEFHIFKRKK